MAHNVQNWTCDTFTQTDILPQNKLFLCGYVTSVKANVHRIRIATIELIYPSVMTFKTFFTIQWSSIYD